MIRDATPKETMYQDLARSTEDAGQRQAVGVGQIVGSYGREAQCHSQQLAIVCARC